jgi:hypothetical protein
VCFSLTGFQAWRKDPRRLVGYLGYREPGKGLNGLHHVVPGTGSYAFISDRAMFVHNLYLSSLSYFSSRQSDCCCDLSLSAQVSAAFERAPVVVKANVMDLVVEGSFNDTLIGARHHQIGLCDDRCLPSWLPQLDDQNAFPQQHIAIFG